MSTYFEKSRELGNLIRESEQSKRLADARAAFSADIEASRKMAEFKEFERSAQAGGVPVAAQLESLKKAPVIRELLEAEAEYDALFEQVIEVLRLTVYGEEADARGTGKCGGCAGCGANLSHEQSQ